MNDVLGEEMSIEYYVPMRTWPGSSQGLCATTLDGVEIRPLTMIVLQDAARLTFCLTPPLSPATTGLLVFQLNSKRRTFGSGESRVPPDLLNLLSVSDNQDMQYRTDLVGDMRAFELGRDIEMMGEKRGPREVAPPCRFQSSNQGRFADFGMSPDPELRRQRWMSAITYFPTLSMKLTKQQRQNKHSKQHNLNFLSAARPCTRLMDGTE
ncbi:hypothetical protein QBC35DRAFT_473800 [Podospora australis]|uniref:Uncharacterized protein n=1 Tax=Podospora australis TaxID=1536484 RepID=A0AAN6WU31_9PEZI|nr:hypothetical protein QBC35DRAFT_473800 [Podospora australis]